MGAVTAESIRQHLCDTQPGFSRWLAEHSEIEPIQATGLHPMQALPRIIIRQMLSGKASDTIIGRAEAKAREQGRTDIADLDYMDLLECGLSRTKAQTICDFSLSYQQNPSAIDGWQRLNDEALLNAVMAHKGIGRWTASILAIFHYGREDIFPGGDSSLRKAIQLIGEQGVYITPAKSSPYRSYLACYLWQLLDQKRI